MHRTRRRFVLSLLFLLALLLSGCGGGGGSSVGGSGGGGGGGGGSNTPSISLLAPSQQMVGLPVGLVTVIGQNFSSNSQVLVNGQPVPTIYDQGGAALQAAIGESINANPGTYQFSVQSGALSNSLPYTVYAPQQGPFVMQAIPGFLAAGVSNPTFIAAADIDGDGLSDVILPGPTADTGSIVILHGQSNGALSSAQSISVPVTPYSLAVGDIDGNGTPDLVLVAATTPSTIAVSIMHGDGHGSFQLPVTQQTFTGLFPGPAYVTDIDGDGRPDLVLAIQTPSVTTDLIWMQNTGAGLAQPVTLATIANNNFCVADFNGDGRPDFVYTTPSGSTTSQSLHILMNEGGGVFTDQAAGGLSGIVGFTTVLDFNLDGMPDLVVQVANQTSGAYDVYSFAAIGNGSFAQAGKTSSPLGPILLVSGDFDHDGFPDLAGATGTEPSEMIYFFGDGHGNFTSQVVVGPEGYYAAAADFNGDGIPDVVVPDQFNFVSLSLGRTDRNFPSPQALSPATVTTLWAGDINGDGFPEIFAAGSAIYDISGTVFLNNGNNSYQFGASTNSSAFMMADLSGRGVDDLLGYNVNLEIWPNNGSLGFTASPIAISQPATNVGVADMDGDGKPDILAAGQILYGLVISLL